MTGTVTCDLAILGGGLAGGLIALALAKTRPEVRTVIVEQGKDLGGNHIWSFFAEDIEPQNRWLTAPLVTHGWKNYDVAFPGLARTLDAIYYSIDSSHFDEVVRAALPRRAIITGRKVLASNPAAAVLDDGTRIEAQAVIDARGAAELSHLDIGYQKFAGQLLTLKEPHWRTRPLIMDATVEQRDGYRFVYCLPFGPAQMFVEDTYYSTTPDLHQPDIAANIADYARAQGWQVECIERNEQGILPILMGGDFAAYWQAGGRDMPKAGARAALFHPTTGYSLPDAVRLAALMTTLKDFSAAHLHRITHDFARRHWHRGKFYHVLDRMMMRAARPEERYRIFERFYRLDPRLIGRFYAGRSTMADRFRILSGKPPVPIGWALAALGEKTA
jgi:lycopene beta-cyclase